MRRPTTLLATALVGVILGAIATSRGARAQSRARASRCSAACERLLSGSADQLRLCTLCLSDPNGVSAWVERARPLPAAARTDLDWSVRWAALKRSAGEARQEPRQALAQWINDAGGAERTLACLTGAYVAGSRRERLGDTLSPPATGAASAREAGAPTTPPTGTATDAGTHAAAACAAVARAVELRAAEDLRSPEPALRADALALAARGLDLPPVRLALMTIVEVPPGLASELARALVDEARSRSCSLGRELLEAARPGDAVAVNRLLASFAALRDEQRPLLRAETLAARRQAVEHLAPLAPLSNDELRTALDDASPQIRRIAATGIARAEGRGLTEAVHVRLDGSTPVPSSERLLWLRLLGNERDERCAALARALWRDVTQPDALRGEALTVLAGCAGPTAFEDLEEASAQANLALKHGALRGALAMPREPRTLPIVAAALALDDGPILEAALPGAAALGLKGAAGRVAELTGHPSPAVRSAALDVLGFLDPRRSEAVAITRLENDQEPSVRASAAKLLGEVGSARCAAALGKTASHDADPRVKFIAGDSLRKLGFSLPPRSSTP